MDSSQQDPNTLQSPASSRASTSFSIPAANYLTVPSTKPSGFYPSLPGPTSSEEDDLELELYPPSRQSTPTSNHFPHILEPPRSRLPSNQPPSRSPSCSEGYSTAVPGPFYMSVYSTSSAASEQSTYSNPPARVYRVPSFQNMSSSRKITVAEKDQMIQSLRSHQINTLIELRRIERAFALLGSPDVTEPMTAAWSYYVNSHGLLTEMRALTKNYPFSAECLEEAKNRVYSDPQSNRSWNFCWLVLSKIKNDKLIPYYAHYQAAQPAMWGGRTPTSEGVDKLSAAFVVEWTWALEQMLRHWDQPPTSR